MGQIEINHTGSGGGVVLSSDGTNLLLGGSAVGGGGGASASDDLYAASPSSATDPTATGSNSVAIGSDAQATATNGSIAFGQATRATGNSTAAIGYVANASGAGALAIGYTANAAASFSAAVGYNAKTETGSGSVALGTSYASGASSFAAAITNNTSSYGATGANSVAIGYQAKATGSKSVSIGERVNTTNSYSYSLGSQIDNGGQYSAVLSGYDVTISGGLYNVAIGTTLDIDAVNGGMAFGNQSSVTKDYSMAFGRYAHTNIKGQFAFSGHSLGDGSMSSRANGCIYILYSDTTDATAEAMTTTNSTAAADNQIAAPTNDTCIMFSGTIVAMQNGAADQGGWEIKGLLKNDGGTTTLVNSNVQTFAEGNGWAVALSADNTNNALKVQVTGEASHNIRWVANIQTSEVTYA